MDRFHSAICLCSRNFKCAKDKIIDCCTKLNLDRSKNDDAIKNLLDGNVIQSYTYNSNLCYKVKKNFEGTNTDSYIAHNETETPLNIAKLKISLKKKFNPLKTKFIDDFESVKESFFSEINSFKMEMMQPNTDISESIDSSERLIKQLEDEIIFAREELTNKNNKIKYVLDQSVMGLCSNTECHSYRKSANDSILSTNEKKTHSNSGEIHTDEKDLLNNNVLLHEESTEPSK